MSMEFVRSVINGEMQAVDQLIRTRLHSEVPLISQIGEYIIAGGGKRLRPMMVLLAARALGYQGDRHHELAAMIELIHTSTLLHDDVVDESALRRGRETANHLFGNAASVLVGDFLYTRAFQMMVSAHSMRIMEVMADATNIIAEGEVLQLMNIGNVDIDEAAYLQVIQFKTAKLFEAATRIGAILCDADSATEEAIARYGMHLGTAFQIIDDVLDYSGAQDEIGKSLGDDLAEGKPTLPLIYLMQHGTEAQAGLVRHALQNASRDSFPAIATAVTQSGALDYARQIAQAEARHAQAQLDHLADTPYRQALQQLATLAVNRQN